MSCYYQGCNKKGVTKEHIPPKSFFPDDQKNQLITVKSCKEHNNTKSKDDLYALAQITMSASPNNRAREVFQAKIMPQLKYNNEAFKKMLAQGAVRESDDSVAYKVDTARMNNFFTSLSCGLIYRTHGKSLPTDFEIGHFYHNFRSSDNQYDLHFMRIVENFYSKAPMDFINFGEAGAKNESIYSVKIFGLPNFQSSITVVHLFFGVFKVTSMLSKKLVIDGY